MLRSSSPLLPLRLLRLRERETTYHTALITLEKGRDHTTSLDHQTTGHTSLVLTW
jgi:hypothetical protein